MNNIQTNYIRPLSIFWTEQNDEVKENLSAARTAVLKTAANAVMTAGVGLAVTGIAFAIYKIATLVIGLIILPLGIFPPLWSLVSQVAGATVAGICGYTVAKKWGAEFFEQTKMHWNDAKDFFQKAQNARNPS